MARSSHPPLLCLDLTADAVQATFLGGARVHGRPPQVGEAVPAWATPVALGDDAIGWRVGQIAYGRRLVDAEHALAHVPAQLAARATAGGSAAGDLELPLAHLLAHATRRALGEPEPEATVDAQDAAGDGEATVADEADGEDGADGAAAAGSGHEAQAELAADEAAEDDEARPAPVAATDDAEPAAASPLAGCEAVLMLAPALPASVHAALVRAAEQAGLPSPGSVLKDEALAWATWQKLRTDAHAKAVQAAQAATSGAQPAAALPAANAAQSEDANEPPGDAEDAAAPAAEDAAVGDAAPGAKEAVEAHHAGAEGDAAGEQTAEAAAEPAPPTENEGGAGPAAPSLPDAWLQLDLGRDRLAISEVQVVDGRPAIGRRAQEPRASLAALAERTQAWGEAAWATAHGERPLDALGQRRLAEGAARLFARLDADDAAALSLPAMAVDDAEDTGEATLVSLDAPLSQGEAHAWLAELAEAAAGAWAPFAGPAESAPEAKAAKGKRRRKAAAPVEQAGDGWPGLVLTGDWSAWPGLRAALLARFPGHQTLAAPGAVALAEAARALAFEAVARAAA